MKGKIDKIRKLRDDAHAVVVSCKDEITLDNREYDARYEEDVLNRVLKILGEEENESYISRTFVCDDGIGGDGFTDGDVRLRYNR